MTARRSRERYAGRCPRPASRQGAGWRSHGNGDEIVLDHVVLGRVVLEEVVDLVVFDRVAGRAFLVAPEEPRLMSMRRS